MPPSADLMKLLKLCGLFGTLVIDEDGIYDMSDFNDRLLIGLKGTMGEAELHFLHARMIGGKENAAARGELRFPLPVGYIRDLDGNAIMDPDEEMQNALFTLFREFRATGSAYGVVRYFAQNNLSFPKRAYGGAWDGKISWGTLTHSRVLSVIHNPSYTDTYVYGIQTLFIEWYVWFALIKSLFFAFIISSISSFYGYTVQGGSIEVGKASTDAVVMSNIMILLTDVLLTKLLMM